MQHSLNWQSGHVSIERQKKITKKYNILSKHNQRRSKTRVLSAFAKATRTAQLQQMKKLSCDQTVPIFYQTVKMLLSSCLMSHSFANTCHKIINITRPKSAYAPGLWRSARKWWFFVTHKNTHFSIRKFWVDIGQSHIDPISKATVSDWVSDKAS